MLPPAGPALPQRIDGVVVEATGIESSAVACSTFGCAMVTVGSRKVAGFGTVTLAELAFAAVFLLRASPKNLFCAGAQFGRPEAAESRVPDALPPFEGLLPPSVFRSLTGSADAAAFGAQALVRSSPGALALAVGRSS